MQDSAVRWGWGIAPWGLIAAIGMLAAVEATLIRLDCDAMTAASANFQFARRACREGAKCRVLCFGDSQVKLGLLPRVVESRSGLSTFNLSIAGGLAPATYFAFRRALREGASPSAILVDYNPALLQTPPYGQSPFLTGLIDFRDLLEYARAVKSARYLGVLLVEHLVPSIRNRTQIRSRVLASFRDGTRTGDLICRITWRNWQANLGAQAVPEVAPQVDMRDFDASLLDDRGPSGHYLNLHYIDALLKLASREKIAVYWLLPPFSPRAQRDRERLGGDVALTRLVRKAQRRHPDLIVLDARWAGFDESCFFDAVHMNLKGSEGLSAAVGSAVGRGPRGTRPDERWITLRRPKARSADLPPIEDMNQSAVALERAEGTRKL